MSKTAAASLVAVPDHPTGRKLLETVAAFIPAGLTRDGLETACEIPPDHFNQAVTKLGTGDQVSAFDTVPFCLWSAAYHLEDFEEALWWTVAGYGDSDTTCAIVGGIVALATGSIPPDWLDRREPLP